MKNPPQSLLYSHLAGVAICVYLSLFGVARAAEPDSSDSKRLNSLNQNGLLMINAVANFPLALFVDIEPRWTSTDPARLDALLKELSMTPFKVLINSSGTVGTLDEISSYHRELAKYGLFEIVGIQDYYSSDTVTNRVPNSAAMYAGSSDEQAVRQIVREVGRHPTVAGWYVFDCVPENPPLVNEHYQWVKSEDAKRPVFLQCFMPTYQQDHYVSACDILINDVYPFDKVLAQAAGFEINQPAKYPKDGLILWAAIQGNSWFEYSVHDEVRKQMDAGTRPAIETDRTRIPLKNQLVSLALLAWIQNHTGAVFSHPHSILTSDEADRRWPVIVEVANEIGKLSSVLVLPALEGGATSDTSTVRCKVVQSEDSRYLIAVNASESAQSTSLHLSASAGTIELLAGGGKATLSGQQVQVQLDVWQNVVVKLK